MEIKELANIVREYGVAGAGGAGFPTYGKLDIRANTILLNCAECEPLIKVHRQLLEKHAYEIMYGLTMIAKVTNANQIIIGVKEGYVHTIEALKANMESFPSISIHLLPEIYPMGDEVILIYETTQIVVPPGSLPIDMGVAVFNVETVYNIYKAVTKKESVHNKYLTIAGEVHNPVTIKVPIGITVGEVVKLAGGAKTEDVEYFMGGPMTGEVVHSYETITKTTNAILVLPKTHSVIQRNLGNSSIDMKRAMGICCQCEMCTDLCPRYMLGHPITPHLFMQAATSGVTRDVGPFINTMFCCSCGICEMFACPQGLAPRKLITEYKSGLRKSGVAIPKDIPLRPIDKMRDYRKIPMERLIARLGLMEYDVDAPLIDMEVDVQKVKIKLNQHIGAKAVPQVRLHDQVSIGDMIAKAEEDKLSLPVHASITGKVTEINDNYIIISKQ